MFAAIIPTYQREALIRRAIESALAQTCPPVEVIVVDDGSTDRTLARLDAYGSEVRVVSQPQSGSAAARNRGVGTATAEWVAFLDSDDEWNPDHLERVAGAIAATDGEADLYFRDTAVALGRLGTSDAGGRTTSLWSRAGFDVDGAMLVRDGSCWVSSPTQPMAVSSSVVRRSRYLEVGGMWPMLRLRHDTHLFFKLGLGRPVCAVPGVGASLTADASDIRLTRDVTPLARPYWRETVLMYEDLLRGPASAPVRAELRDPRNGPLADRENRVGGVQTEWGVACARQRIPDETVVRPPQGVRGLRVGPDGPVASDRRGRVHSLIARLPVACSRMPAERRPTSDRGRPVRCLGGR